MFVSDCLDINAAGHLTIGGCDAVALAETFGTPLYVMDETAVREALREFQSAAGGIPGRAAVFPWK